MPSKKAHANSPRTLKRRANAVAALAANKTRNIAAPKVSKANYKKEAEERALAAKALEEANIALEVAQKAAVVAAYAVKTAEEAAVKIEAHQAEKLGVKAAKEAMNAEIEAARRVAARHRAEYVRSFQGAAGRLQNAMVTHSGM